MVQLDFFLSQSYAELCIDVHNFWTCDVRFTILRDLFFLVYFGLAPITMSVEELEVALCCTLDNTVVTTRLSFTDPPKKVDDIKSSIQTAFYLPQCMQELLYNGAVLSGTEQVQKLVRYYSKLDVNDFEVINTWPRKIRDIVLSYEKDDPAHVLRRLRSFNSSDSNQNCPHQDVADLINKWGTPRAKVNRSYIFQDRGIDLVF